MSSMNEKMARVAPELESKYASYPMTGSMWLDPNGTIADGSPAFKASATDTSGLKADFVYGPGTLGRGYYHLLTRDSYGILYKRLASTAPAACCSCNKDARDLASDHQEVKLICYYRSIASIPNDAKAKEQGLAIARGEAQEAYHFTQNVQLAVGAYAIATS